MLTSLVAATTALAVLTVAPGPDMAVVTRVALTGGRAAASRTVLGVVTGLIIWGGLTAVGLAAILAASANAYLAVKVVGGAYLILLGVKSLASAHRPSAVPSLRMPASSVPWKQGLATNLLNPKIAVFYTGLLPGLVPAGASLTGTLVMLVIIHAALTFAWLNLYAALLVQAGDALDRPLVQRSLHAITGCILIGFGLRTLSSSSRRFL